VFALINKTEDLISQLFSDYSEKLFRAAKVKLHNYHTAEDVVQDVFVLALEKREMLLIHPYPEGWLFIVLRKKLLHELRACIRSKALQEKLELILSTVQPAEYGSRSDRFDSISEKEYILLSMIYVDGSPMRTVAEKLGISYETCRRRVQKAKHKIIDRD